MTCADTSSLVAYIQGEGGPDVELVDRALAAYSLALAPSRTFTLEGFRYIYFLRGGCDGRISMRLASVVEGYV